MSSGLYVPEWDWAAGGAVLGGAISLASGIPVAIAKPFVALFKSGIDAVSMLHSVNADISQLNAQKEQLLLNHYQSSQQSKNEFIQQMSQTLDFKTLPVSSQSLNQQLEKQNTDGKIALLRQAIDISQRFAQFERIYQQAVDLSDQMALDLTPYAAFYSQYLNGSFKDKPIAEIHDLLSQQLQNLKSFLVAQKDAIREAMLSQQFNEFFFDLNHTIETPILSVLDAQYASLLLAKVIDEESFEKKKKIIGFKENLIKTMIQIDGLQFLGEDYAEAKKLFESGIEFFQREDLSENDRFDFVEVRSKILFNYRVSMEEKHKDLLKIKDKFDEKYRAYRFFADSLGVKPIEFELTPNSLPQALVVLDSEIARLQKDYQRNQLLMMIRHTIRKALMKRNQRPLASNKKVTAQGVVYQDIYEAGNGNVLVVNINEKGMVNYQVKGVKVPGMGNNPNDIRTGMRHTCPMMESTLNDLLPQNGQSITKFYGAQETSIALMDINELPPQAQQVILEQRSISDSGKALLERAEPNE